ncbi:uncharacterized protein LOC116024277 [Ipomoea triloba]|uniref:uncharacterized protein LOC116024277 n=1 Tax=Ipomoea triloba TaxID=35885 RepID=UPI00125E6F0D|nr:uncharacterized protein LOC116024277 [Ipomoea triloba]
MSDNIFLAQELIRGYSRKRISPRCMIKVDLKKAYDTIDWDFIKEALEGLRFPTKFIDWIMECVSSTSFSISVNGCLYGHFDGKRGLRQGDPISPLIFTICIEYFSRVLKTKAHSPLFTFHPKCSQLGITHLAFADDLMLFSKGNPASVTILLNALKELEETSGLTVSIEKSNIFVAGIQDNRLDFSGMPKGQLPVKYLGIPLDGQRLKVAQFSPLITAITRLIEKWKGCTLSYAGRLELIISVIQGTISFWIQNFPLPANVIDHVAFLWGRRVSLITWDKICFPKEEGGLGIHDFKVWNTSFFSKVLWDIHSKRDSLWIRWVNSVYLNGNDVWEFCPNKRDSALFKKIFEARDKISLAKGGVQNAKEFLHNSVNNNKFQVSQIYDLLREKSQPAFAWRFVWRSYIPRKFSFITWLAVHQRIPTKDRLAFLDINTDCSMCVGDKETAQHLFFKCPFSLQVWNQVRMHFGFHKCTNAIKSSIKWINRLHGGARLRSKAITIALICTIYHLWRNRNRVHHDEDRLPIDGLVKNIAKDVYRVIFYLYPIT